MSRFLGSNMRNKNKTSCYANYVKFVTNDIVPLNYDIIIPRNKKKYTKYPKNIHFKMLQNKLNIWDEDFTDYLGSEIIVPFVQM